MQCRRLWFDSWVGKFPWRRNRLPTPVFLGFPGGSDDNEFAWSVGRPEFNSWVDLLKEGLATHSSILARRILLNRGACRATVRGVAKSDMTERLSTAQLSAIVRSAVKEAYRM